MICAKLHEYVQSLNEKEGKEKAEKSSTEAANSTAGGIEKRILATTRDFYINGVYKDKMYYIDEDGKESERVTPNGYISVASISGEHIEHIKMLKENVKSYSYINENKRIIEKIDRLLEECCAN